MSEGIKNILVTGGLGFIGSNFLNEFVAKFRQINFINLDKMTYAANPDNVNVSSQVNYFFEKGDICDLNFVDSVFGKYAIDAVVHFAAESHVDFSITNPALFVHTNVLGTQNLLQTAQFLFPAPHSMR